MVGSLLAADAHVVCGYFCTTTGITPQARVFDSNGYDIAHDWVPASDGKFDVFGKCKSVFALLKAESAKESGDLGNYAVYDESSATISLIYILVDSLRPTQTKT